MTMLYDVDAKGNVTMELCSEYDANGKLRMDKLHSLMVRVQNCERGAYHVQAYHERGQASRADCDAAWSARAKAWQALETYVRNLEGGAR